MVTGRVEAPVQSRITQQNHAVKRLNKMVSMVFKRILERTLTVQCSLVLGREGGGGGGQDHPGAHGFDSQPKGSGFKPQCPQPTCNLLINHVIDVVCSGYVALDKSIILPTEF